MGNEHRLINETSLIYDARAGLFIVKVFTNPLRVTFSSRITNLSGRVSCISILKSTFDARALGRDLNAARNIVEIGRGPPESKSVGSMACVRPSGAGQVGSVKQETSLFIGGSSRGFPTDREQRARHGVFDYGYVGN